MTFYIMEERFTFFNTMHTPFQICTPLRRSNSLYHTSKKEAEHLNSDFLATIELECNCFVFVNSC